MNLIIESFDDPRLKCELCSRKLNIDSEGYISCCGRFYSAKSQRRDKYSIRSYTKDQYIQMRNMETQVEEDMEVETMDEESANLVAELESTIDIDEDLEIVKNSETVPDVTSQDVVEE